MAGVVECTPGFARDAFGLLYTKANRIGCRIKFSHVDKDLRPIILKNIASVKSL